MWRHSAEAVDRRPAAWLVAEGVEAEAAADRDPLEELGFRPRGDVPDLAERPGGALHVEVGSHNQPGTPT